MHIMFSRLSSLLLLGIATPVYADNTSPWSFGGSIGYDVTISGKVLNSGISNDRDFRNIDPRLPQDGNFNLRGLDFKDAYDPSLRATLEVGYKMSGGNEFFGALSYTNTESSTSVVGCIEGLTGCVTDVTATLSDLRQTGFEIGYRKWFDMSVLSGALRPYVAVRYGMVRTEGIDALLETPLGDVESIRLYKDAYSYILGGEFGATIAISPNAEIGGEIGLRYQTALKQNDANLSLAGLGTINDSSERLSVPISFRLNAAF